MDPTVRKFWCTCSLLSLSAALVTFSMSQFVEIQFGNSKLPVSIIVVIMAVGFSCFVHKTDFIRNIMDLISKHRFCWIIKAIVVFIILVSVTMLNVLMKYPRFRLSDKQETRSISDIRAYCRKPNFHDPQIKAICLNLPEEHNSKQGDKMEFVSAVAFSFFAFCISILLTLPEEYGLFYMCLELTMHTAVEIPGIGGSILNWYYVGPTAFYCFLLIIVQCYYNSSDEVRTAGGNGDDHRDDGIDGDRQPTVLRDELRQPNSDPVIVYLPKF